MKDGTIILNGFFERNGLRQMKALIRFYFHEDVGNDSKRLVELWSQLSFALRFDGKMKLNEKIKG
jgi:hypothetical protein